MIAAATRWFPLWALAGALAGWLWPEPFTAARAAVVPLLGVVMFGMGITLTPGNFLDVARRPAAVALGVALQFLLMPAAGWLVATGLGLEPMLVAGVVLVGACPGGTASNVICYLARGDVALSITLTAVSTVLAVVATPLLTMLYVGERVPVPVLDMLASIARVVLAPVILGVVVNHLLHRRLAPLRHVFPLVSVLAIAVIIAIVVALNAERLGTVPAALVAAVAGHNLLGLLSGYGLARLLGRDRRTARTLAIEVGMQNSGLAVALAVKHLAPVAALPGVLFSVWHNLSGAVLAAWWGRR